MTQRRRRVPLDQRKETRRPYDASPIPPVHCTRLQQCPEVQQVAMPDECSGIYFLIDDGEIVYVGQSLTVELRVRSHRLEGTKTFDSALFIPVAPEDLNAVEGTMIRALHPRLNGHGPVGRPWQDEEILSRYGIADLAATAKRYR